MWLLQSCPRSGSLIFRAGARLILCEPAGIERTLFKDEFFTLDASLAACKAVLWKKEELILLDWSKGTTTAIVSDSPTDFAISPDGEKIAFAEDCLRIFSDGEFRLVSSAPEAATPSFSPDGQSIAFLNGDYELWRVNLDGTDLSRLAWVVDPTLLVSERKGSYQCKPAWSSDGRLVAQLRWAKNCPERKDGRNEFASVIVDFQEARSEVWPGYHHHSNFRPSAGSPNFRWSSPPC